MPAPGGASAGNLASCNISSVIWTDSNSNVVDVTNYWKAYADSFTKAIKVVKTGSNVGTSGAVTSTAGTIGTLVITFNSGAWNVGTASGTMTVATQYNGGGMLDNASTSITVPGRTRR